MPTDAQRIATARRLLAQLGVTVADLLRDERPAVPTIAEHVPLAMAAAGPGARRTYGTYWQRMAAARGSRPLDVISASDIEAMQHQMAATARSRRNADTAATPANTSPPPPAPRLIGPSPTASSTPAPARPIG